MGGITVERTVVATAVPWIRRDRETLERVELALKEMDPGSIARFLEASRVSYVTGLVGNGMDSGEAERLAADQQAEAFPDGRPARGHLLFDVVGDDEICGHLWIGPRAIGDVKQWWVWDIEIAEPHRGRGIGRWVMQMAEDHARHQGAEEIGLSVFADNAVARRLYDDLGYREVSLRLRKSL